MHFVDDEYLNHIHRDALRVLEEVGVKCASTKVRRIFEDTGLAAFDETTGHVHVLPQLVEQALNMAPKRDKFWIPENAFGVGGTAPFVYDDRTGDLVEPTFEHLVKIAKIVDEADAVLFMAEDYRNDHDHVVENWHALIGGRLDVRPITGLHNEILEEPHVCVLASELSASLRESGSRTPGTTDRTTPG